MYCHRVLSATSKSEKPLREGEVYDDQKDPDPETSAVRCHVDRMVHVDYGKQIRAKRKLPPPSSIALYRLFRLQHLLWDALHEMKY